MAICKQRSIEDRIAKGAKVYPTETPVKQEFKKMCDINHIMATMHKTGQLRVSPNEPVYADMSEIPADKHQLILKAQELMEKYEDVVGKLNMTPFEFTEFIQDPKNKEALEKAGLKFTAWEQTEQAKEVNVSRETSPQEEKKEEKE